MEIKVAPCMENGKELEQRAQPRSFPFPLKTTMILFVFMVLVLGFVGPSMYMAPLYWDRNATVQAVAALLPCTGGEESGLQRWIRAPSNLMHTMTDEELFWRASFVPQVKKYPFKRVPKVAFMFLTRGPLPLSPLWEMFFRGHQGLYSIYIHALPSYKPEYPPTSAFHFRQIPSQVSEWGKMNMCDAERRLLANALLDISNERFVLLSEACIPLYNFSVVYDYLMRSRYSFVGSFVDLGPHGRGRYNPKMSPEVNLTEWRKGAQWFEVNRDIAVRIVRDDKYYPKFKEFCKPACYVDEHYFPTMLSIESPHLIANTSVTFVDWSRGGPHPATFGKDDITEEFLKSLAERHTCSYNDKPSRICFLFARKFAPSALEPLLNYAPKFLGFN